MHISCNFPGGNGVWTIDAEQQIITLKPDLRDSTEEWFYWSIAIDGPRAGGWVIQLPNDLCLSGAGPAISRDHWRSWEWLTSEFVDLDAGRFQLPEGGETLYLAVAPPYTMAHWQRACARWQQDAGFSLAMIGTSAAGRAIPVAQFGNPDGKHLLCLSARHHCCEMQANRIIDGFCSAIMSETSAGASWLKDNASIHVIPFIDIDGVEAGDQGKNRAPHDHNRDYGSATRWPETEAYRNYVQKLNKIPDIGFDIHCPWIRRDRNETAFIVGLEGDAIQERQRNLLNDWVAANKGELPNNGEDFIAFGVDWNNRKKTGTEKLNNCSRWLHETLGVKLAATLETPYGLVHNIKVSEANLHQLGAELAEATASYLQDP